nr:uroporphyrinogen-III synthase [Elizabethkingia bruuniana]
MHFCSSKALSTLKNQLSEAGFDFAEKIVYETIPLYPEWNPPTDAIVFFSPSGVESFMKNNSVKIKIICHWRNNGQLSKIFYRQRNYKK